MILESGEKPEPGPEHGSDAAIRGGSLGQPEVQDAQTLRAELDGEQRRPCRADDGGMSCADRIENRSKRTKFIEFAVIAFPVLPIKHDGYIRQFVLMAGHRTRHRLAEFRKHHVWGIQTSPNRGKEFASSQDFTGLGEVGHEVETIPATNGQQGGLFAAMFNPFKTRGYDSVKMARNVGRPG